MDARAHLSGSGGVDDDVVPAGAQPVVAHDDVDVAGAVRAGAHGGAAHADRDRQVGHGYVDELAPAALGVDEDESSRENSIQSKIA